MATRVELPKDQIKHCIELAVASAKRALNTSKKPEFKVLYEKDLAELTHALNTITEIK